MREHDQMKTYQIISDSSCDIPQELLHQYQIDLIPFYVTFDQETYRKENIEITTGEFYRILNESNVIPKTSLPSVQDYMDLFEPILKEGKDILCFCITHKFSGSLQSAINARSILLEKYEDARIELVDSSLATAAQGLLVLEAAKMQQAGYSIDGTVKRISKLRETARIMFTVNTLEYLTKGGRVGKAASLAGTMLNLKPMIMLREGELMPYSNVRGRKKSLKKIIDMIEEHFHDYNLRYDDYEFCFACTEHDSEDLNWVIGKTEQLIGRKVTLMPFQIGVTIGTYTGPGALGCCFIRKYNS